MASAASTTTTTTKPTEVAAPQAEAESSTVPSFDSTIEREVFDQLLEMDDEDDRTFSQEIVWNFFEQATSTFADMDTALEEKDLAKLSTLGHFLKGSSAAVGVAHVRDLCEAMQHLGKLHDESGVEDISREEALSKLQTTIKDVKARYQDAEAVLKKFYEDEGMPGGPDGADEGEEEDE